LSDYKFDKDLISLFRDVDYNGIETRLLAGLLSGKRQYDHPPSCEEEEQLRLLAETDIGDEPKVHVGVDFAMRNAMNLMVQSPSLPSTIYVSPETMKDLKEDLETVESEDVHTGHVTLIEVE
jgi:hypothetical protein